MACNLNFNQCNFGCSFPRPIFNCKCKLLSLLNSSNLSVVNPLPESPSLILSSIFPHFVDSNTNIDSAISFLSGNAIKLINKTFTLTEGRYLVSYAITGAISSNGMLSVGIDQDGFLISGSESSSSGIVGGTSNLTNSTIIHVTSPSSIISLKNINSVSQSIASGNITIQKL